MKVMIVLSFIGFIMCIIFSALKLKITVLSISIENLKNKAKANNLFLIVLCSFSIK